MGTNLYATSKGTLTPLNFDRDLNDDGYIDAILINEWALTYNGFKHDTVSYIYWNSLRGFSIRKRDSFKTYGAEAAAIEDINNDGYEDIIVANSGYDITFPYTYIYYGKPDGFSYFPDDSILSYPNHGSISVGDINLDGYLDIVTSTWYGSDYSFIFYGNEGEYSKVYCDSFLTHQAHGNKIADFDKNGLPDVFFAIYSANNNADTWSYIYYQKGTRIWIKDSIKTMGAGDDISVIDLNRDGFLDIVIPNHSSEPIHHSTYHWSYIYYGSLNGFSHLPDDSIYTFASWSCSVGYLNDDTFPDVVFSNFPYDTQYSYSYIYYSRDGTFAPYPDDSLPINCGTGITIADFDNDGSDEILIGSQEHSRINNAILYKKNSAGTWVAIDYLPAYGQDAGITQDAGNIYDLSDTVTYFSSVFDAYSIKEKEVICDTVFWETQMTFHGDTALDTLLRPYIDVFIRHGTGITPVSIKWSSWHKVLNHSKLHSARCRFVQYKVVFHKLCFSYIALKSITIGLKIPEDTLPPAVVYNVIKNHARLPVLFGHHTPANINILDRNGRIHELFKGDITGNVYFLELPEKITTGIYWIIIKTPSRNYRTPILIIRN